MLFILQNITIMLAICAYEVDLWIVYNCFIMCHTKIAADDILISFQENKAWCFKWILCLAKDSLETSSLIFSEKQWENIYGCRLLRSVIGALRVNMYAIILQEPWLFQAVIYTLFLRFYWDDIAYYTICFPNKYLETVFKNLDNKCRIRLRFYLWF